MTSAVPVQCCVPLRAPRLTDEEAVATGQPSPLDDDLPTGEGWVKIEGYVNTGGNSITLTKTDELNIAMYGGPILIAGVFMVFGPRQKATATATASVRPES